MEKKNESNQITGGFYLISAYRTRVTLMVIADCLTILLSYCFALWMRFDFRFSMIPKEHIDKLGKFLPAILAASIICYLIFHLYQSVWSYVSIQEAIFIARAYLVIAILAVLLFFIPPLRIPISCLIVGFLLSGFFCILIRFGYRALRYLRNERLRDDEEGTYKERILLIGAGEAARNLIREIKRNFGGRMRIVGCVDDNPTKTGRFLEGVRILGGREEIPELVEKERVDRIVFCIPSATPRQRSDILSICKETGCRVQSVPGIYQIVNDEVKVTQIRDIDIADLLGREELILDREEVNKELRGKTVLVTGAGGSIGSELCMQIAAAKPEKLIMLDIYENSLYMLSQDMKRRYPELSFKTRIASVRDRLAIRHILEEYRPQIIYHAAAHKHVPLMEGSPGEAVSNNVGGTWLLAEAAGEMKTERFILISTDKAVNPTNIMGASKRICEMVIQMMGRRYPGTIYASVRFGNVLGSNGSVIPLFRRQIENGGPVTVTDPQATRFFMTIPEAVSLVLQAGCYARCGESFVLDMGEPVKILDLAENLIKLSGFRPYTDIPIEFIGLREGEKLYEEILMDEEGLRKTDNHKIFIARPIEFDDAWFAGMVGKLKEVSENDEASIRPLVKAIVPTYQYDEGAEAEKTHADHGGRR